MNWREEKAVHQSEHPVIRKVLDAGYKLEHDRSEPTRIDQYAPSTVKLQIRAYRGETLVGWAHFSDSCFGLLVGLDGEPHVLPEHRRKGIGSAMYVYVEELTGHTVEDHPGTRTPEAQAMWDQPNRPFGNHPPGKG